MIHLETVTPDNWRLGLQVRDDQHNYVSDSAGILARAYAYRNNRSQVFIIYNDDLPVGMGMYYDLDDFNAYNLSQFFIDQRYQGKGYGSEALGLILNELRKEGHYDHVEVCVKKDDSAAIRLYEKNGFVDSGYIDEDAPDSLNMICRLC